MDDVIRNEQELATALSNKQEIILIEGELVAFVMEIIGTGRVINMGILGIVLIILIAIFSPTSTITTILISLAIIVSIFAYSMKIRFSKNPSRPHSELRHYRIIDKSGDRLLLEKMNY